MLLSESFQKNSRWSSHFGSHEPRLTTECDDIPVPEILLLYGIGKNWSGKNSGYRHTMSYCPLERYVYVPPVQCIPPEPSVFHPTKKGNFLRGTFIFLWNSGWPGWGQLPSHKSVAIVYFVLLNLLVDLLLIRILVLVHLPSRISLGKFRPMGGWKKVPPGGRRWWHRKLLIAPPLCLGANPSARLNIWFIMVLRLQKDIVEGI